MTELPAELARVVRVLGGLGYSAAWLLEPVDEVEQVVLVPDEEIRPRRLRSDVLKLTKVVPNRKVYIVPFRPDVPVIRLY